jgi:hypothetical protein
MLQPLFEWISGLAISQAIGESLWIYPLVQAIHLVFLAMLLGALLLVDLRLLGVGFSKQPVSQVARDARPWLIGGLVGMVLTGIPQLMQNAMREYYAQFFWWKMYFLAAALIFTFTIRWKATQGSSVPGYGKIVGVVSIALWGGVAISARLIGLFD